MHTFIPPVGLSQAQGDARYPQLAQVPRNVDTVADLLAINPATLTDGEMRELKGYGVPFDGGGGLVRAVAGKAFSAATSDTFTCVRHGLNRGDPVKLHNLSSTGAGVSNDTVYYAFLIAGDTFKLAATQVQALAGTPAIDITSAITGELNPPADAAPIGGRVMEPLGAYAGSSWRWVRPVKDYAHMSWWGASGSDATTFAGIPASSNLMTLSPGQPLVDFAVGHGVRLENANQVVQTDRLTLSGTAVSSPNPICVLLDGIPYSVPLATGDTAVLAAGKLANLANYTPVYSEDPPVHGWSAAQGTNAGVDDNQVTYTATATGPGTAYSTGQTYSVGQVIRPTTNNGFYYEVTAGATSGTAEPTWTTTIGGTTNATGGTAVFTNRGRVYTAAYGARVGVMFLSNQPGLVFSGITATATTPTKGSKDFVSTITSISGNVLTLANSTPVGGGATGQLLHHDDSAAVENAFAACVNPYKAVKHPLFGKVGEYKISRPVRIVANGMEFKGAGAVISLDTAQYSVGGTVFNWQGPSLPSQFPMFEVHLRNCEFSNFTMATGTGSLHVCMRFARYTDITPTPNFNPSKPELHNVNITNPATSASSATVYNFAAEVTGYYPNTLDSNNEYVLFRHCNIEKYLRAGVHLFYCSQAQTYLNYGQLIGQTTGGAHGVRGTGNMGGLILIGTGGGRHSLSDFRLSFNSQVRVYIEGWNSEDTPRLLTSEGTNPSRVPWPIRISNLRYATTVFPADGVFIDYQYGGPLVIEENYFKFLTNATPQPIIKLTSTTGSGASVKHENNTYMHFHTTTNMVNPLSVVAGNWEITDRGNTAMRQNSASDATTAGPFTIPLPNPTIAAGAGAGTSPTLVTVTGSRNAGRINISTGTTPTVSATVATVTLSPALPAAPNVALRPANAAAAALSGASSVYVDRASTTTTQFLVKVGSGGLAATTAYEWFYEVIQ